MDSSPCDENADCTNTDGSYSCACKQGFTGDGTICEGILEYYFLYKSYWNEHDSLCIVLYCCCLLLFCFSFSITSDIDECSAESSPCDENADCTNSDGSYFCTCKQGFDGDGVNCKGITNRKIQ